MTPAEAQKVVDTLVIRRQRLQARLEDNRVALAAAVRQQTLAAASENEALVRRTTSEQVAM